jgi:hypothetical protein
MITIKLLTILALNGIPTNVAKIPLPEGYHRIELPAGSFAEWLRELPLKRDKTVYLYDGRKKSNQNVQYAVLDISTGKKDLQQCADAVMRLRAEWLKARNRFTEIVFYDNNGKAYACPPNPSAEAYQRYLDKVFSWCGTASLSKQLKKKQDARKILPGDVFIHGGFPGHAAMVMDVAVNNQGQLIYLLMNSYMPAQDMHIVLNPTEGNLSPWYSLSESTSLEIPEWTFQLSELKSW